MKSTRKRSLMIAVDVIGITSLVIAALFLTPLAPEMPSAGLDGSWRYALNVAVEQGLVFGRDLVFTFGPLGSVYTGLYSPATDTMMMIASTWFACGFCLLVALALYPGRLAFAIVLPVLIAMGPLRDSVFLAAPFLLLFAVARTQLSPGDRFYLRATLFVQVCIGFASVAIGITPIVKGSFAASAGATYAIAAIIIALRSRVTAIAFALLGLITLCISWTAAGQPLSALPHYFLAQAPIISGYTNAMSFPGRTWVPILVGCVSLIIAIYFHASFGRGRGAIGTCASLGLALVLFIIFKAAMVRQDGHVFIATGSLLLITLAITARSTPLAALPLWILVFVTWKSVGHSVAPIGYGYIGELLNGTWTHTLSGIETRVFSPASLHAEYVRANAKIRADEPLPAVKGTVDIYPTDLSAIFANNLRWKGRPVIQSYSVYDSDLDNLNAGHLERAGADTIFFSLDPIDNRLPAFEDSTSLISLVAQYSPVAYDGKYVQFARHAGAPTATIEPIALLARTARLGEPVSVHSDAPLWATIDVKPTLTGKLMSAAYKLPQLEIELALSNGQIQRRRFIPAIGSTGFVLSPYLRNTADLLSLASGIASTPTVVSFKVEPESSLLWKRTYSLQLRRIDIAAQRSVSALRPVEPDAPPQPLTVPQSAPQPSCTIDSVNHKPFVAGHPITVSNGVLSLQGWSAPSASVPARSIRTYFVVRDAAGVRYFAAPPKDRPDVANTLHQPDLATSGFDVTLDLGERSGAARTLQMVVLADGTAWRCPFEIPVN